MASKENESPAVYTIPPNYKESGTLFGGTLKTRNAIESGVIGFIIAYIVFKTGLSLSNKVIVLCFTVLPVVLFAIIGINGESLLSFAMNWLRFMKNRRIIGKENHLNADNDKDKEKNRLTAILKRFKWNTKEHNENILVKKPEQLVGKTYIKTINQVAAYLPVLKIDNGIIYTKDKRYIKFIEVKPINFLLRNNREQKNIIYSFVSFLKTSPVKVQFKVITRRADINKHIESVRLDMAKETDENCRKLQKDYENLLIKIGSKEAIKRRFFIVFEYEPGYGVQAKNTETDAVAQLKTVVQTVQSYLRQCGNEILEYEDDNSFMMETLYGLLNRNIKSEKPFRQHQSEVIHRFIDAHGPVKHINEIPAAEFFAPKTIDCTHSNYILMDGVYHAYMLIPSEGYKPYVLAGWTSLLINAGEGIDVDIYFHRQPKDKIQQKLGQQIRINRSRIKDASDTNADFDDLGGAISSGYFLKKGLSNNEDFYFINILVTVTAYSEEELDWRVNEMKKLMISQDLDVYKCAFRQEQAFLSALPLLHMDKFLYNRSKRNTLSLGAASCYPFTSYEMCDDNGILLGVNKHNNSLIIVDIFNSLVYKNANICILGTTGAGKTFLLQLLASRFRRKGIPVIIIAPEKGHEFYRCCQNIGGEFIQFSPASDNCINFMEIRKEDNINNDLIDGITIEKSLLIRKVEWIHLLFSIMLPDITHEEKQILDEALLITYERFGITHENESLVHPYDPNHYRLMPIPGDLYETLESMENTRRLMIALKRFVSGSAKSMNQQTNVNLKSLYTVLDLSEMKGDLLLINMLILIEFVLSKTKEDRTKEIAVIFDELWKLIGAGSNSEVAMYILEVFKLIRGYAGSAISATQDLSDHMALDGGKYGRGIINACKTKIVLNLEDDEAQVVKNTLNLSETEVMAITHFQRGSGLICTNNNNIMVDIKASQLEKELITTDRQELLNIVERKQKERVYVNE